MKIKQVDGLDYSTDEKIQLVLSARLLGNRLQQELKRQSLIPSQATKEEIADMLNVNPKTLANRLGELRNNKSLTSDGKDAFRMLGHAIPTLVDNLKKKRGKTRG